MKTLTEFKNWLKDITEKNLENEQLDFVWEIMKSPYVEFHYELLKDQSLSSDFRRSLSGRFNMHGESAEDFLISKLNNNEDIEFHGEIIFLIGKINKKYKSEILAYARSLAENTNDYTRDRALIVLGWIGTINDTEILRNHLLNDTNSKCRAWSASSYMQMWFKNESELLKSRAFEAYQDALKKETDYFVTSTILTAIREIGKTKLGISQTVLNELDVDKIDSAKLKAIRFLEKTLKSKKNNNRDQIDTNSQTTQKRNRL